MWEQCRQRRCQHHRYKKERSALRGTGQCLLLAAELALGFWKTIFDALKRVRSSNIEVGQLLNREWLGDHCTHSTRAAMLE
mmetsp:Transcript_8115/g.17805  ORF Transcript_8115/g.17805 Transcript_8115/m.17805 type:complete len:81 (-) Transcript_8115:183-425(-)